MGTVAFKQATKKTSKLRLAFIAPAGGGKTYSALAVGSALAEGARIAVIDTERGSASLYADAFAFDVLELMSYAAERYVEAISAAESAGYSVIVIDSLSHAWTGADGALDKVNAKGGRFDAWKSVTPGFNALIDKILGSKCHVIVTLRTKTEYVVEKNSDGKSVPRKIGLAPVFRDGIEYEFTVTGELDQEHTLSITKTRCAELDGAVIRKPGAQLAGTLLAWLNSGASVVDTSAADIAEIEAAAGHAELVALNPRLGASYPEGHARRAEVLAAYKARAAALAGIAVVTK